MPTVYYIVPDYNVSSWGIGMLYLHVRLLNRNGIQAFVLHHKKPFKCSWFESDTPIVYLDDPSFAVKERDILVVPELSAAEAIPKGLQCRKIVFVQNTFILLRAMERALTYDELGYERAMVILPHMERIVETHFGVRASVIPPVVAPYFFIDKDDLHKERKKNIVLFPKAAYKDLGHVDYDILIKLLKRCLGVGNEGILERIGGRLGRGGGSDWKLIELEGKTHTQVAGIMKESAFFVCVNTLEGFNTTVPEAMAAGCVPVCYEAYGGRDFLEDGKNAYVFPNNYIYPLVDKLFELIDTYAEVQDELSGIR